MSDLTKKVEKVTGFAPIPPRVNLHGAVVPTASLTLRAIEAALAQLEAAATAAYKDYEKLESGEAYNALLDFEVNENMARKATEAARCALIERIESLDNDKAALLVVTRAARRFGAQPNDNAFRVIAAVDSA